MPQKVYSMLLIITESDRENGITTLRRKSEELEPLQRAEEGDK